jgi:hypothetical protein
MSPKDTMVLHAKADYANRQRTCNAEFLQIRE